MTAPVVTCRPADRIDSVLGVMTLRRIRHLPVLESGALVGIVSIGNGFGFVFWTMPGTVVGFPIAVGAFDKVKVAVSV